MAEVTMETETPKTKETIPLWLAVAITVIVFVPFGLYFGQYNLPLWVCFVVWAEYFALGAKPQVLRTIIPAYAAGVFWGVCMMLLYTLLAPHLTQPAVWGLYIALVIGVCPMVYIMKYFKVLQKGSLPYFNGLAMLLGVYFVGAHPTFTSNAYMIVIIAGCYALAAGYLGAILAWFNVTITFPRTLI